MIPPVPSSVLPTYSGTLGTRGTSRVCLVCRGAGVESESLGWTGRQVGLVPPQGGTRAQRRLREKVECSRSAGGRHGSPGRFCTLMTRRFVCISLPPCVSLELRVKPQRGSFLNPMNQWGCVKFLVARVAEAMKEVKYGTPREPAIGGVRRAAPCSAVLWGPTHPEATEGWMSVERRSRGAGWLDLLPWQRSAQCARPGRRFSEVFPLVGTRAKMMIRAAHFANALSRRSVATVRDCHARHGDAEGGGAAPRITLRPRRRRAAAAASWARVDR